MKSLRIRAKQGGFTLIELMIALTAGAVIIGAAYAIGAGSSRAFQEQQRVSQTQMSLRTAMEMLRRDIARAGHLGSPNSVNDQRCRVPTQEIQAVFFQNDVDNDQIPEFAANVVSADRIALTGSYDTTDYFLVESVSAAGTTLFLSQNWLAYRRNFGPPATFSPTAFADLFLAGRVLRLVTPQGNVFYGTITGTNAGAASVSFNPALPVAQGDPCLAGLGGQTTVAVLSRVRYEIAGPGRINAASLTDTAVTTGAPSFLVRREVRIDGSNADNVVATAAGTREMVLLDYAVDLNFEFMMDTVGAAQTTLVRMDGAAAAPVLANVNLAPSQPQRVRSVIVSLSARTADQDPRFQFIARANAAAPLTRFRALPTTRGASRVRTARTEIFLPNLAR